LEELN